MRSPAKLSVLVAAAHLLAGGDASAQCVRYTVIEIQATSGATTWAFDINEAGQVAVAGDGASIWFDGVMQPLGVLPGGFWSVARGINDAGQVAGWSQTTASNNNRHAFLWNGSLIDLGTLGGGWSDGNDINNLGQVCGRASTGPQYDHACVWTSGGVIDLVTAAGLPNSPSTNTEAHAINDSFQVTGGGLNGHAFFWENNQMFDLGTLGGSWSQAFGINEQGQVVGESGAPGTTGMAFLWTNGQMFGLGVLPGGNRSQASDINNHGVIVGFANVPGGQAAVRWSPTGGLQDLNDLIDPASGWQLQAAEAVNDAGLIVGSGLKNGPPTRGFLLVPVAESTPVTLEIFDPNPELLVDGAVIEDVDVLHGHAGPPVLGLVADGVTQLLLRVQGLPGPGDVLFSLRDELGFPTGGNGTLSTLDGGETDDFLTVPAQLLADNSYGAFALLEAPADFARDAADEDSPWRAVRVGAEYAALGREPPGCMTLSLELHRAPVVLVHGLWSSAGTWDYAIQGDARFEVWEQDYSGSHAAHFASNAGVVRTAVASAVQGLRDRGIAATQADVFGHSMGGLLARRHVGGVGSTPLRNDNFFQGDVRRLITIDTPHQGSPLAGVLVDAFGQSTLVGAAFDSGGLCTDCGAIFDLRPDSPAIQTLPSIGLPVHAIVGTGGSDLVQTGLEALLPPPAALVLSILRFFGVIDDVFPVGLQHDMIVGRLSQEGGLGTGSTQTSVVGFVPGESIAVHTSVTSEPVVGARVLALAQAPIGDDVLFAGGFPSGPGALLGPPAPPLFGECTDCLTITSPTPGATVQPGAALAVSVAPLAGFAPERVMVVVDGVAVVDDQAPFDLVLDVPAGSIGTLALEAFGIDAADTVGRAATVSLTVDVPATLMGIEVSPDPAYLFEFAPSQQLTVRGLYDDGVTRDLTGAALGTVYGMSDACPAGVSASGVVTALCTGTTEVQVANGAHSALATVRIVSAPAGSSPAFCNAADGALALCPCSNPGSPDTGCDIPQATGGVGLCVLSQTTSPNGATLQGNGFPTGGAPTAVVIRSPDLATPVVFGDGVLCLDGSSGLTRLAATVATGGVSTHAFGHGAMAGAGTFHYQLWFRSTPSTFCDPTAAFNLSSGRSLVW